MTVETFSDTLRHAGEPEWSAAVGHRFTTMLGDDTLDDAVFRRYLIQDYGFIDALVSMIGYGVAKAPGMPAKVRLSRFLAALTSDENSYFLRSFDALGVPEAERAAPALAPVTRDLVAALDDAGANGDYGDIVATLLPAEWIYLSWAKAQADKAPQRFYLKEWIDLHADPAFTDFVMWLKAELDAIGTRTSPEERERLGERFRRIVALEVRFFDAAFGEDRGAQETR